MLSDSVRVCCFGADESLASSVASFTQSSARRAIRRTFLSGCSYKDTAETKFVNSNFRRPSAPGDRPPERRIQNPEQRVFWERSPTSPMPISPTLQWIVLGVVVVVALAADLAIFHREAHEVKIKEALVESAGWIGLSLAFNAWIWFSRGHEAAVQFLTAYVL